MKFYLDSAIYEEIAEGVKWGVIDGVTTNPTLIAKAGRDHEEQVKRICGIIGNVSAEVVSENADDINWQYPVVNAVILACGVGLNRLGAAARARRRSRRPA